jgi:UDP-N-acetylmuramate--alanine ligase
VLNAAGAFAAAAELGLAGPPAAAALQAYGGAQRRMEPKGDEDGVRVLDSYAHHPTEVAADLAAARDLADGGRVIAIFQPHLFSRTQELHREFGAALASADVAVALDVYPARERAEDFPGVSGKLIAEAATDAAGGRTVYWLPTFDEALAVLGPRLRDGDLVLVMGAGDIDSLGRALVG